MGSRVRVVNVTRVHPAAQTGDPSPPCHYGEYKLSFLDFVHLAKRPIQRLLFFDGPDLPPFPSIVRTLQSSLAATLAVFLPLAGKLAFRAPDDGDDVVVIDCSPDAVSSGVRFVEAEFFDGDMRRLARDAEHDTDAFEQLVPDLDAARLPAPVLAVQVTGGDGGTVALGVAIHHAVADGHAVWQFMRAWSTRAREGSLAGLPTPTFDRAGVRHPKGGDLTRAVLRLFAPELPLLRRPPSSAAPTHDTAQQSRRTFVLRAKDIQTLKQRILLQQQIGALTGRSEEAPPKPPSTYVAVTSLVWTSLVRAKAKAKPSPHHDAAEGEEDEDDCYFMVSADCRRRLSPPLGDGFFGNCVTAFYAVARRGDLRERGAAASLARAAKAIGDAVREHLEEDLDPLAGFERFLAAYRAVPRERVSVVGSSHRFAAYETDFGWGAPTRVELVSLFARELVTLLGAREEGAVQVSVALDRAVMEAFAACFVVPAPNSSDGE